MFREFVWNDRPGDRWIFPATLLTRILPETLHPSSAWSFSFSAQRSFLHCKKNLWDDWCPSLLFADTNLINGFRVHEAPPAIYICLSDRFTCVATSTFRFKTAITRTTVTILFHLAYFIEIASQLRNLRVGDYITFRVEPSFHNVVRDISLSFSTDIHNIKADD